MTTLTRKQFFRGGIARMIRAFTTPAPIRPPGARSEDAFLDLCTRCDDCVKACPEWVIRKSAADGTPTIVPAENPCIMCEGFPCIAACTTGALRMPDGRVSIGAAVVDAARCYQAQGQPCDYCVKECPERPRAIVAGSPPRVRVDLCTGCGKCAQICPPRAVRIEAP